MINRARWGSEATKGARKIFIKNRYLRDIKLSDEENKKKDVEDTEECKKFPSTKRKSSLMKKKGQEVNEMPLSMI